MSPPAANLLASLVSLALLLAMGGCAVWVLGKAGGAIVKLIAFIVTLIVLGFVVTTALEVLEATWVYVAIAGTGTGVWRLVVRQRRYETPAAEIRTASGPVIEHSIK